MKKWLFVNAFSFMFLAAGLVVFLINISPVKRIIYKLTGLKGLTNKYRGVKNHGQN